jgi:nicotinate-nucleotide adenylyltransferase
MKVRVGVLGGSFDPVHRGHVTIAVHALQELGLERVLLLPCADPPHKPDRILAERYHRLEMLYLAAEDRSGLQVSTLEIMQSGVRYTIDTLRALREGSAGLTPVFLCGADAIADIGSWRECDALLAEFDFVVFSRPDETGSPRGWPDVVTRRLARHSPRDRTVLGSGGSVIRLEIPPIAAASSLVRSRRSAGRSIDDLVPTRVARYIQRHRLYSEEAPR